MLMTLTFLPVILRSIFSGYGNLQEELVDHETNSAEEHLTLNENTNATFQKLLQTYHHMYLPFLREVRHKLDKL